MRFPGLGVLLENTGGIVIDGWLRFYGAGELNILERNKLVPFRELAIAEDVLGGVFLLLADGNVGYFAPDCLEVEEMEFQTGRFLTWCLHGDTELFYSDYRWEGWQKDVSKLRCDEGFAFYPFLFAKADGIESRARRKVPMRRSSAWNSISCGSWGRGKPGPRKNKKTGHACVTARRQISADRGAVKGGFIRYAYDIMPIVHLPMKTKR